MQFVMLVTASSCKLEDDDDTICTKSEFEKIQVKYTTGATGMAYNPIDC